MRHSTSARKVRGFTFATTAQPGMIWRMPWSLPNSRSIWRAMGTTWSYRPSAW